MLDAWGLGGARVTALGDGLINRTFLVQSPTGERRVLQALNSIFAPEIHGDIEAVTRHLEARGLATPRLVPTADGRLCLTVSDEVWRLQTFVPGRTLTRVGNPAQAESAGHLLGRFHVALADLDHGFAAPRLGVHDTTRHLEALQAALEMHRDHPNFARVRPLGGTILEAAASLPALPSAPPRIVHGDPKISNVIFEDDADVAVCFVDLDTLGPMAVALELGDALRSWCNASGEDSTRASFDLDTFQAAVTGYGNATRGLLTDDEWRSIVPATSTIMVELAARFCADALNESYFGWDATRFPSRSEHNRVRAEGQLALAGCFLADADRAASMVEQAFIGA